jgi:serine/threonine protein phosphatase PrpC
MSQWLQSNLLDMFDQPILEQAASRSRVLQQSEWETAFAAADAAGMKSISPDSSGAVAAVAHIADAGDFAENPMLTTAWCGDCRIVLGKKSPQDAHQGLWHATELTVDHELSQNEQERARLKAAFPDNKRVWAGSRLMGNLQPSRAFGDIFFKADSHASGNQAHDRDIVMMENPYLISTPQVLHTPLQKGAEQFVLLGSDGIFEDWSSQRVVEVVGAMIDYEEGRKTLQAMHVQFPDDSELSPESESDGAGSGPEPGPGANDRLNQILSLSLPGGTTEELQSLKLNVSSKLISRLLIGCSEPAEFPVEYLEEEEAWKVVRYTLALRNYSRYSARGIHDDYTVMLLRFRGTE